jgi:MFS family permease
MMVLGSNRTFGVFLDPMLAELGWTRTVMSGGFTLSFITMGIMGIVAGKLTDRYGPKLVLIICGVILCSSYVLTAFVTAVWQYYLFFGLMSGIAMSCGSSPILSVVARWFHKRRSLMTGIVSSGLAAGNVIFPMAFALIIQAYDWRISYIILGCVVLPVIVSAAMFLKRDPEQIGLKPLGIDTADIKNDIQNTGLSLKQALRTNQFWLLAVVNFCDFLLVNLVTAHIVIHVTDLGFTPAISASVLSIAAGVSVPARIAAGAFADRIGNRKTLIMLLILPVFGFTLLLVASELWMFYLFAILYGVGLWASGVVTSPLVAKIFGLKSHGTLLASVMMGGLMGGAVGPVLGGFIFDNTGSYQFAFLMCLIIVLISLTSIICLKPLKNSEIN